MEEDELNELSPQLKKRNVNNENNSGITNNTDSSTVLRDPKILYSVGHAGDDIKFISSNLLGSEKNENKTFLDKERHDTDIAAMSILSLYDRQHGQMDKEMDTERYFKNVLYLEKIIIQIKNYT